VKVGRRCLKLCCEQTPGLPRPTQLSPPRRVQKPTTLSVRREQKDFAANPVGDPPVLAAVPAAAHPRAARRDAETRPDHPSAQGAGRAGTAAPSHPRARSGTSGARWWLRRDQPASKGKDKQSSSRDSQGRDPAADKEPHRWYQTVRGRASRVAPRARPGLPQLGHCHTSLPPRTGATARSALQKLLPLGSAIPPTAAASPPPNKAKTNTELCVHLMHQCQVGSGHHSVRRSLEPGWAQSDGSWLVPSPSQPRGCWAFCSSLQPWQWQSSCFAGSDCWSERGRPAAQAAPRPELTSRFLAKEAKPPELQVHKAPGPLPPSLYTAVGRRQQHLLSLGSREGIKSSAERPRFHSELNISCYQIFS